MRPTLHHGFQTWLIIDLKGEPTAAMLNGYAVKLYSKKLRLSVHSGCDDLHKTGTRSNQSKFQHMGQGKGHWGSILREGNTGSRWFLKEGESLSFSGMTSGQFPLFQGWSLTHVHMGSTNWTQGCIIFSLKKKKEGVKLGVRWGGGHRGRWMDMIKIHCIIYEHFKQ